MAFNTTEHMKYFTLGDKDETGSKAAVKLKAKKEDAGAVKFVVKGEDYYYHVFDTFSGVLVDIKTQEHDTYGKSWQFVFMDDGEKFVWTQNYTHAYAMAFLKYLKNIDVSKEITLIPTKQKSKTSEDYFPSLIVKQDGTFVKSAYTKDAPNGFPAEKEVKVNGTKVKDKSAQMEFLEKMINDVVRPQFGKAVTQQATVEVAEESEDGEVPF